MPVSSRPRALLLFSLVASLGFLMAACAPAWAYKDVTCPPGQDPFCGDLGCDISVCAPYAPPFQDPRNRLSMGAGGADGFSRGRPLRRPTLTRSGHGSDPRHSRLCREFEAAWRLSMEIGTAP